MVSFPNEMEDAVVGHPEDAYYQEGKNKGHDIGRHLPYRGDQFLIASYCCG